MRKELEQHKDDQSIASILIRNTPLVDLSSLSPFLQTIGETIRIRLSSADADSGGHFSQGEKVARLFFLNQSEDNPLPIRPDKESLEMDDGNYSVEFEPLCSMHQIIMTMAVSPVPHTYTIATISLPDADMLYNREAVLAGIEERVRLNA